MSRGTFEDRHVFCIRLTPCVTASFGIAAESRTGRIAIGQPRERHHRGPHTEIESLVFVIIAFPIDSARSLFLIFLYWRKKGETRVKWVSIWSVKESDRILFGVLSVLVFCIGAWDLVSRKSWSSLYFSEDVVILGAWSVTFAYFTIGAIDIMGMFVGTMTEYVARWYKNRVLENAREEIREQVREEVRKQVREEVLQELREGRQDKTDAGEVK